MTWLGPRPVLLALTLLFIASCEPADREGPVRRPNLLLITVDTLRADRLGCYGLERARTETIDALAAEGTLFTAASTCISRTTQAIASAFTSRYPHQHGSIEIGDPVVPGLPNLAEILAEAGYVTAGISANVVAGPREGLHRGFQEFVDAATLVRRYPIWRDFRPPAEPPYESWASAVTKEAGRWLRQQQGDRPFFLWLLYFDPHWLYNPPPPYDRVVDRERFTYYDDFVAMRSRNATAYFNLDGSSERWRDELVRLYDAEVTVVDETIGRLLRLLSERDEAADTLVVFTSDHGESLGEHGYYYEHGDLVYDASMRIPLIFRWPGRIAAGRRVAAPASLLDLLPTLLTLLDLPAPDGAEFEGMDLAPLLTGSPNEIPDGLRGRVVLGESGSALLPQNPLRHLGGTLTEKSETASYLRHGKWVVQRLRESGAVRLHDAERDPLLERDVSRRHPDLLRELTTLLDATPILAGRWRMARDERWKLIRIPESKRVRWELYDLASDPHETRNVAARRPQEVRRLRRHLEQWIAGIPAEPVAGREMTAEEIDAVRERLRSLGYID